LEHKAIRIYTLGDKKMVHSFEFYKATCLKRQNYTRWLMETVFEIGKLEKDIFPASENVAGRTIRFRLRYYFDLEFAIGLCLVAKRKEALQLREFLINNK
jgi:hypothetical protein